MKRHLHRFWARAVDEVSFGIINACHARHAAEAQDLHDYIGGWSIRSFEAYYELDPAATAPAHAVLALLRPDPARPSMVRFPSPLANPRGPRANNTAVFELYPGPAGWGAPTLLIAHGLMSVGAGGYRALAARLNRRGWNAVFVHLPYHYERRPALTLSGELAVTPDLVRTVEGVRQAVLEMRLLLQWLSGHGGGLFAGWGTSYGAWTMALLGCVEPLLQRLILVEPMLDIDTAIWHSPACVVIRRALLKRGITQQSTMPHLRLCCPLHVPPRLDPARVLMLAGTYDRIASPATVRALHARWPGSHYYEFPQGHVGYRLMPESFRLAEELWPEDWPRV